MPIAEGRKYTSQAEPVVEAVRSLDEDLPDVSLSTVVGIGRKVSTVINTTAQREDADVVVVGWHGTVREGNVRGSVVQEVLRTADRDVVVVKDHGLPNRIDEVLAGAKPGLHAGHTLDLAADLATGFDASVRVVSVSRPGDDQPQTERFLTGVREHMADRLPADRVRVDAVASDDVSATFVERARSSGLVVIGASRDWVLSRTLLGDFADGLANQVRRSVAMLRPDESRPRSLWRQAIGVLRRRSQRSR